MYSWAACGSSITALLREDDELRKAVKGYSNLGALQTRMTVGYQAFYAAFSQMSASAQPQFVLVLPVLKHLQKNLTNRLLSGYEGMKPEVLTLSVEFSYALLVSCCMQRSTSVYTNLVLIALDLGLICFSLYDLHCILRSVEAQATWAPENRLHRYHLENRRRIPDALCQRTISGTATRRAIGTARPHNE